jgi:steroid delta-isomerase-like uncharacterized protein
MERSRQRGIKPEVAIMTNESLARRWFEEVWNQQRAETVRELLAPQAVCHSDLGKMVGAEPFVAYHQQLLTALPDLKVVVEATIAQGDDVVVRWRATGTHTGVFEGKKGTGEPIQFGGMTWVRFQGGRVVEGWDAWNVSALMLQLQGGAT